MVTEREVKPGSSVSWRSRGSDTEGKPRTPDEVVSLISDYEAVTI